MVGTRPILSPGFGNANVAAKENQPARSHQSCQRKNQPHSPHVPRPLLGEKGGKQPPAGADKEFADEEGKVRQRTVRSFLSSWSNRSSILVYPGRIEGFAD